MVLMRWARTAEEVARLLCEADRDLAKRLTVDDAEKNEKHSFSRCQLILSLVSRGKSKTCLD